MTSNPSGKWATQFGKTFQKKYVEFVKISIEKVQNPLTIGKDQKELE